MRSARDMHPKQGYKVSHPSDAPMFLAFLLSRFTRSSRFVWSPALDLRDRRVYAALITGTHS